MDDLESEESTPASGKDHRPVTEENTPEDAGEVIHIPTEFLQGTKFREGDELVLKVVAVGDDGLEVAYAKAPEGEKGGESDASGGSSDMDEMDAQY